MGTYNRSSRPYPSQSTRNCHPEASELPRCDLERKVLRKQPYLLSRPLERSGNPAPIGMSAHLERKAEESRAHLSPYASAAAKVCSYRGDSHLLLLVGEWGVSNPAMPQMVKPLKQMRPVSYGHTQPTEDRRPGVKLQHIASYSPGSGSSSPSIGLQTITQRKACPHTEHHAESAKPGR